MSFTDSVTASEEINSLTTQSVNFLPEIADKALPSGFLSLIPLTSDSYPRPRKYSAPVVTPVKETPAAAATSSIALKEPVSPIVAACIAAAAPVAANSVVPTAATSTVGQLKTRRSSSLSSDNSQVGFRFLKLGPVHWGEHLDDHQQDWHEAAIV